MSSKRSRELKVLQSNIRSILFFSVKTEAKTHTRHPHTGGSHHRSIRADTGTNLSNEEGQPDYTRLYAKQNVKLVLECAVNINFSTSIWLKDGQIVQTLLKDNTYNKRVTGHRLAT